MIQSRNGTGIPVYKFDILQLPLLFDQFFKQENSTERACVACHVSVHAHVGVRGWMRVRLSQRRRKQACC